MKPDYFEVRMEVRQNQYYWIANHQHDFICNVYERIGYAIKNDLDKVQLFNETLGRRTLRRVNIYLKELKSGSYMNLMLKHFEKCEDYEKCNNIKKWMNYIKQK